MAKFQIQEILGSTYYTVRLGAGPTDAGNLKGTEKGKFVKLAGSSRYDLCVPGDEIEGFIVTVEAATADGFSIGSIRIEDRIPVTLDGLQATPGTGTINIGDYVVVGSVVPKGTAQTAPVKVCAATVQPSSTNYVGKFMWRLVANNDLNGAVGTTGVIERVNA